MEMYSREQRRVEDETKRRRDEKTREREREREWNRRKAEKRWEKPRAGRLKILQGLKRMTPPCRREIIPRFFPTSHTSRRCPRRDRRLLLPSCASRCTHSSPSPFLFLPPHLDYRVIPFFSYRGSTFSLVIAKRIKERKDDTWLVSTRG